MESKEQALSEKVKDLELDNFNVFQFTYIIDVKKVYFCNEFFNARKT